jgi:hypothetical protein
MRRAAALINQTAGTASPDMTNSRALAPGVPAGKLLTETVHEPLAVGVNVPRHSVASDGSRVRDTAPAVTCQPELAMPNIELPDFEELPVSVSANDWGVLTALTVPPGHYVLAGPMSLVGPHVAMAAVAPNGTGTLIRLGDPAVLDSVTYVDLGTLATGRYVGVVRGYELQAGASEGLINATVIGWAVALVVGP